MSYSFSFADNATYSATDVNRITSRLVTRGVTDPFKDEVPYNLSKFNEAGTLIYTDGAVPDSVNTLKVTVNGSTATINHGTAFFSDGASITIELGGHTLSLIDGAVNYVYLKNDLIASNECYPVVSTEAPTRIDVPLAEICDGVVTDKRKYAMGKLPGYASNANYRLLIQDTVETDGRTIPSKTYDIGNNNYIMLFSKYSEPRGATGGGSVSMAAYCFSDGTYLSAGVESSRGRREDDCLELWRDGSITIRATVSVAEANGVKQLTLNFNFFNDGSSVKPPREFPLELYLF